MSENTKPGQAVKRYFASADFELQELQGEGNGELYATAMSVNILGPTGMPTPEEETVELQLLAHVVHDDSVFTFYVVSDLRVPEENRHRVLEYISRVNYGVSAGCFEMDIGDGEVRYRSSINFSDSELTPVLVRNIVEPALGTAVQYWPSLLDVASGRLIPEAAIAAAETGQDPIQA